MKVYPNWEKVSEVNEIESIKAGGYVIRIMNVENVADREYLKISYDIAEGEYKDYYKELYKNANFWGGSFIRSYKESAIRFFKGFITAVENSNKGYTWNWDEQTLKGKLVGIVLQEEEYIPQQGNHKGEIRTRLICQEIKSADKIRKGDFKVKDKKTINLANEINTEIKSNDFKFDDDEIQF